MDKELQALKRKVFWSYLIGELMLYDLTFLPILYAWKPLPLNIMMLVLAGFSLAALWMTLKDFSVLHDCHDLNHRRSRLQRLHEHGRKLRLYANPLGLAYVFLVRIVWKRGLAKLW